MKKVIQIQKIIFFSIIVLLLSVNAISQDCSIDLSSSRQTIRGFGGMNFPRWISDLSSTAVDKAFGTGSGQIGLTILRISVPPDQNDWSGEVPTAQRAKSHGAIVFATPWSPPASMKTNNSTTGGSLSTSQYNAYANHLRDFCNYMSNNGASLYAISVQNEPDYVPDYESCGWTSSQMRTFLDNNASIIPVKVIAPETVNPKSDWYNALSSASQLDIYADHLYGGSPTSFSKEHWMTEHYTNSSISANQWPEALDAGIEIANCMANNYSAYVWWYIRRSYGLITEDGNVSKRGYVMSHFAKFVRPNYIRVNATYSPTSNVYVTAYKSSSTLIIVAINRNSSSRTVNFNFSGDQATNFTKYETTSSSNVANRGTISGGSSMSNSLSGYSISTFVGTIGGGGGSDNIWLEAECGNVGSLWNINSDGNASNDYYVTIQSGYNSTSSAPSSSSGYITYNFSISSSGDYNLWARVITPNGTDDSFWVQMDGGSWYQWNNIGPTSSWAWEQCQSYNLNSGSHTLTVAYREDGAQLDKIYIGNSTPSGEGSTASNLCNPGGSCDPTSITPYISVNDGSWQQISSVTVNSGDKVELGPQPVSGGSWSWSGCGTSGTSREQTIYPTSSCTATATYTNDCGAQSTQNFNITVTSGGGTSEFWLEAECGSVGSLWNINSDGNASNDQYVTIQSGYNSTSSAPTSSSGYITYNFDVSSSGSYNLWARVITPNGTDDSFWVRMDDGSWYQWNNIGPYSSWAWEQCQSYNLSSGSHILTIAYREDGAQLDKLYIGNSTPSGEGSAASNCSAGGGDEPYSITVRARGTAGSEQIRLTVGGSTIQTWTLGTSLNNYTASTSNTGNINVEFINDDGTNRDVQVDYIQVAGSTWQAEDQSTNTGVWQDGSCGGSYSEWLHCDGYIGFNAYRSAGEIADFTNTRLNIYPNPANDMLNVELSEEIRPNAQIRIYNSNGDLVMSMPALENHISLDVTDYPAGIYIIGWQNGQNFNSQTFIVR